MPAHDWQMEHVWKFLLLLLLLSIPFWLFGGYKLPLPINLPANALMFINPMIAAAIFSYKRFGWAGVRELFQKTFDDHKIKNKVWYQPTLFLMPAILLLSYGLMRLAELPLPQLEVPWEWVPVFFLVFLVTAVGEELGWMGRAVEPLQKRWGALGASLLLGTVWAIWHAIPFVQTGNAESWIFWHSPNIKMSTPVKPLFLMVQTISEDRSQI